MIDENSIKVKKTIARLVKKGIKVLGLGNKKKFGKDLTKIVDSLADIFEKQDSFDFNPKKEAVKFLNECNSDDVENTLMEYQNFIMFMFYVYEEIGKRKGIKFKYTA